VATSSQSGVNKAPASRTRGLWGPDGSVLTHDRCPLLAASMVCADPLHIGREVRLLEEGKIDLLHFDVMDGSFVPRIGLGPEIVRAVRQVSELPIDVHLMVSDPEKQIPTFAEAGADIIIVHVEATSQFPRLLELIRSCGSRPAVAMGPATPPSAIAYVLDQVDLVLLMVVNPGSIGEKAIPAAVRKIADVSALLQEQPQRVHIMIDGNVRPDNAPQMIRNGATILVCGSSSIFKPQTKVRDSLVAFRRGLQGEAD